MKVAFHSTENCYQLYQLHYTGLALFSSIFIYYYYTSLQVDALSTSQTESVNDASIKPKSFLQRICMSAKILLPSEYSNSITSAYASKNDSIRALELLSKVILTFDSVYLEQF